MKFVQPPFARRRLKVLRQNDLFHIDDRGKLAAHYLAEAQQINCAVRMYLDEEQYETAAELQELADRCLFLCEHYLSTANPTVWGLPQ